MVAEAEEQVAEAEQAPSSTVLRRAARKTKRAIGFVLAAASILAVYLLWALTEGPLVISA